MFTVCYCLHSHASRTVNILPLRNICTRETTNQCCRSGSRFGSARVRLAVLYPEPDQYWESVLRFRDVYPGSRIRPFSIPDPGSDFFPSRIPDPNCLHTGSRIRIKEFKYFNPKNGFQALENMIRVVHPGSRIQMLTFYGNHPGSRIQWSKRHRIPDPDHQHCWECGSGSINIKIDQNLQINLAPAF
jgi:hypothetical protein